MSRVVLRAMGQADLPEVLAIEAASFPRPWDAEGFRAELARDFAGCVVAVAHADSGARADAGTIVGNLVYWVLAGEAQLLNVAVRPDWRGTGLGRRLVQHVIAAAEAGRAHLVTLEVRRSNVAAIGLYAALGFAVVAVRARYYQDNDEDALVMERPIGAAASEVAHAAG